MVNIPRAGMSVGLFLISLELVMMVIILLYVDRVVGYCFSVSPSRVGWKPRHCESQAIFTKIADIGADQ